MKVIITGVTGMVGEGVLYECLQNNIITDILVISRKSCGYTHPKLKEILHKDFLNVASLQENLIGYDACFFCLGVSSEEISKADYEKFTYDLTLGFAKACVAANPSMQFCYVSGAGTDSSEQGRSHWARVKGKTENDLMKLPFKKVYAFRPGYMQPTKGLKFTLKYYHNISWAYKFLRFAFPNFVTSLQEVAKAMINAVIRGYPSSIIEVKDILVLSN